MARISPRTNKILVFGVLVIPLLLVFSGFTAEDDIGEPKRYCGRIFFDLAPSRLYSPVGGKTIEEP